MKIKKISLTKFRLFDSLVLEFPNSNCITLIGENGGGKSSVLDAISLGLDFFTGKLRSLTNEYSDLNNLKREDIKIGSNEAKVEITFDNNLSVNIHRSIGQYQSLYFTNSNDTVLSGYRSSLKADTIDSLPLLCYYRINRIITFENQSKSLEYSSSYHEMLEAYYNAFDGKLSSFQDFKRWFINQENLENERKIDEGKLHYQLPSLKVVRDSIIHFFNEIEEGYFHNLKGKRKGETRLNYEDNYQSDIVIFKEKTSLKLSQLSSGEKAMLLLVSDIARRLAILNKDHTKALKGEGIVLIDEIDLHLHPRWQRRIIPALRKTFPNIQFIVTTHSPQVLSTTTENSILVLSKGTHYSVNSDPKGRDSNGILEEVMGVEKRPKEIERQIENIFTHLSNGSFSESWIADQIKELKLHISQDDPVLLRINNLIKRKRLLAK